jgi:catechol 2,3-dioxygenase-like lactoylglutathione lyase family enzyme
MADAPRLFRVLLEVADLDKASAFYCKLLDQKGRRVGGGRHYYDCGPVIVGLVDVALEKKRPTPAPQGLYFAVNGLEEVHARAHTLKCLSKEDVHGEPAGDIVTRPWGERCFYAVDPFGNGLCFSDERTLFTGR